MLLFHIFYTLPLVIGLLGICIGVGKEIRNIGWHSLTPSHICQFIGLLLLCFVPIINFLTASYAPVSIWGDEFYENFSRKIKTWFNTPIINKTK